MNFYMMTFLVSIIIGMFMSFIPLLVGESRFSSLNTNQPFECGIESTMLTRSSFSLQFFLVSLIFVMFDLEVVFLLGLVPVVNFVSLVMMQIFIMFMLFGLLYEWKFNKLIWLKC